MATIVLTAVGAAFGGPVGALIGAVAGQAIDASLFAPKPRQGPRLGELAVQTSSYGTAIPKLFGTMRAAGTVIWSTDLQERRGSSGGGKGRPSTVEYSYSASFAVALSGRPIRNVRRIWADGKLLRGVAGDFKSPTKFRLYLGDEDQPVDPFIASAEGSGNSPAYRGTAYAMFEDFQLADYGNRIPSLTFEIEADPGPVSIGAIAEELSDGAVHAGATPTVGGYAASGDSVRGAVEALSDVVPLSLTSDEDGLHMYVAAAPAIEIDMRDAGAGARGNTGRSEFMRRAAGAVAAEVTITYYEPARDYQTGLQRAFRPGRGMRTDRKALPAAISSDEAKAFAERRLATIAAGSGTAKVHLDWRWSSIRPGTVVRLKGEVGLWQIERSTLQAMVVNLELVRIAGQVHSTPSDPGRPVGEPDLRHGPTTVRLLDLPLYPEELAQRPQLLVAATGVEPGWRRADLMASYDAGASWQSVGTTAAPATLGTAVTVLGAGGSALIDAVATVEVQLLNDAIWLEARDDDALISGANLAQIGSELIQFGRVTPLGDGRFRLSRLLRGRMGTEWAADEHKIGEDFLLIDRAALMPLDPPLGSLGAEARLLAIGREDSGEGVAANRVVVGEGLRPPAPVHLRAERRSNGDVALSWVRRSRIAWTWASGSETPLGEERETYRVTLASSEVSRSVEVDVPYLLYSRADQITDGADGAIELQVAQFGTHGSSRPAAIHFNI
jgi:hypothetical protein